MHPEGKWVWSELEEWLMRSRWEFGTGQQQFSHLADPPVGWVTAGASHRIQQQEELSDGKHRKTTRKTEMWNDPLLQLSWVRKERRTHNARNAITHISDSGLMSMCYYSTHILWLYFGYFTSNQVQWERAIKPLGKQRLLGPNRLGGYFTNDWIQGMCKTKYWRNYYLNNHPWWEGHGCRYEWVDTQSQS